MRTLVITFAYMLITYCAAVVVYGAAVTFGPFQIACTIALGWVCFGVLRVLEDTPSTTTSKEG